MVRVVLILPFSYFCILLTINDKCILLRLKIQNDIQKLLRTNVVICILKNIGSNGIIMFSRNVLVFINSKIIIKNSHIING